MNETYKKIVETGVLLTGYSHKEYRGIHAKRRQAICAKDEFGSNGCGTKWYTLELVEEELGDLKGSVPNGQSRD